MYAGIGILGTPDGELWWVFGSGLGTGSRQYYWREPVQGG